VLTLSTLELALWLWGFKRPELLICAHATWAQSNPLNTAAKKVNEPLLNAMVCTLARQVFKSTARVGIVKEKKRFKGY
jgi:hypothetical protein